MIRSDKERTGKSSAPRKAKASSQEKRNKNTPWLKIVPITGFSSRRIFRYFIWAFFSLILVFFLLILLLRSVNPPISSFMWSESRRLGIIAHQWVAIDQINLDLARSVVAAEDANFCNHWGIDVNAVRLAISKGSRRGASTISQQTVKNLFLWQNRSWVRKALEAALTLVIESMWSKRRILEIYLNIIEYDEGVFGIEAAALHYFDVRAADLSPLQAARLAVVLPDPKSRSAVNPVPRLKKLATAIVDGAQTIKLDGRASWCEK